MFDTIARTTADWTGRPLAFVLACALVLVWLLTGPLFQFSDTWQLIINTGTTIITFLMVFCLQYSQDQDTRAIQAKLDSLLCGVEHADETLVDLEHQPRAEVDQAKRDIVENNQGP